MIKAWRRPRNLPNGLKAEVSIVQYRGGHVQSVRIVRSSGNIAFDGSVEQAVLRAAPLPEARDDSLFAANITFVFDPGD